jgi:hypothetical protein
MSAEDQPVRRAVAWGLIVLGWIWVALAGGCTLYFFGNSVVSLIQGSGEDVNWAPLVLVLSLVVGGAGILIGWLILDAERALRRGRRRLDVGWLLTVIGGLWSAQGALGLASMLALTSAGRMMGAVPPALMSLAPAASLLAAGVLILRGNPKRD